MVFANLVTEGAKDSSDCPELGKEMKSRLSDYMKFFRLDTQHCYGQ
jgi:hypothetical protein